MPRLPRLLGLGLAALAIAGCRAATRVVEEPRVDLTIDNSSNRGYLVGTPPPVTGERKTTRKIIQTEFEMPPPRHLQTAPNAGMKDVAPPEVDFAEPMASTETEPAQRYDAYTVKRGDTLWSIAADPKVYGDATKWRRLFSANQSLMKSPDAVRAGMTLRVPRMSGDASKPARAGKTYSK